MAQLVECPKCLGTKQFFNGKYVKNCNTCDKNGLVTVEVYQSFVDEELPFE